MAYAPKKPETSKNKRGRIPGGGDTVYRPGKGSDQSPKRGRIPGGGDTVYRPGKGSGGGSGDTNQQDQGPQPAAKRVKKTGTKKFKFQVQSNKYKIGR